MALRLREGICVNLRDLRAIAMLRWTICVHLCDLWIAMSEMFTDRGRDSAML